MADITGTTAQGATSANAQGAEINAASVAATTTQPVEEAFDKERALETIRRQRASEEALTKESKRLAKIVSDYEAREKAAKDAELSEVDRLKSQLSEAQSAREQVAQEIATLRLRQAVEREAARLKFLNPEDAYLLADMTGVEMDDEGKVKGVEAALKKLLEVRPYLVGTEVKVTPPNINSGATGKGNPSAEERLKALRQRFPSIKS